MQAESSLPKVLIIDDDVQMRFYLMTLVKSLGYEAVLAKDGTQGLERLERIFPDTIVLDIMMPNKGGVQVYRELVTHPVYQTIPVVFFSGVDRAAFFHYIKLLNAAIKEKVPEPKNYVVKDTDPEYLKQVIQACVARKIGVNDLNGKS